MLVDATTLKALQVFESEYNPQAIKQKKTIFGRQFREGVSIFNLCNVCKSVPGKQMLKRWFRRPTTDRSLLIDRHSAISYFYQDCNLEVGRTIRNYLRNVSNVRGTLRRVRSGTATISDWTQIYKTASALSSIFDYVRNMNLKLTATKDVKLYTDDIMRIGALISEIMDIKSSRSEGQFVVRDEVDDELDVSL
uniref:MUTSd domain-containing protein n=1 Tax=Panagrellus redivivus TaxID=6233 RepID=A0A7E4VFR2_PANRE